MKLGGWQHKCQLLATESCFDIPSAYLLIFIHFFSPWPVFIASSPADFQRQHQDNDRDVKWGEFGQIKPVFVNKLNELIMY